jgi:Icc protein
MPQEPYRAALALSQGDDALVGYSVTTIVNDALSWHFVELGSPGLVVITQPADERLMTHRSSGFRHSEELFVCVKTWSHVPVREVTVHIADIRTPLTSMDGVLWTGELDIHPLSDGVYELIATATDVKSDLLSSAVQLRVGPAPKRQFSEVDYENAIGEWCDRGLLGTQLGPNKNGKKW